jgi:hypothetical protein
MPSDRLTQFREYMAAFEGAADPAKSIEHGHYVHAPGQLLVDQIAGRIALRPNSTHLLVGGIGSGKTTQLLVAQKQLEAVEDLAICYVDVSRYTDISQIKPGVLMTIVGLELLNRLPQELRESVADATETLRKSGYGYTETKEIQFRPTSVLNRRDDLVVREKVQSERIEHKGLFTQAADWRIKQSVQKILAALIRHNKKKIIFFCDGLDRMEDVDRFAKIIRSDIQSLKQLGIGLLVVGPMLFTHSEDQDAKDLIDYPYYQPCFDVEQDQDARTFLTDIILTRLPKPDFFEDGVIDRLVQQSGGVLRDLVTLTQAAIEEAYLAGDETLDLTHVEKAVQSLASRMLRISEKEIVVLRNQLKGENFILGTPESFKLLSSRQVLEYRYPTVRYAVHPAIVPLLQPVAA